MLFFLHLLDFVYTWIRFHHQGEKIEARMLFKTTWSETYKTTKGRHRTYHFYKVEIRYPAVGSSLNSTEQIIHKSFMLKNVQRYNDMEVDTPLEILRMPQGYDPRRAYLLSDFKLCSYLEGEMGEC